MPQHRQRGAIGMACRQNSAFQVRKGSHLSALVAARSRIAINEAKEESRLDDNSHDHDWSVNTAEEEKDQFERDPASPPGRDTSGAACIETKESSSVKSMTSLVVPHQMTEAGHNGEEQEEQSVTPTSSIAFDTVEALNETPDGDEINNTDKANNVNVERPYDEVSEDSVGSDSSCQEIADNDSRNVMNEKPDEQAVDTEEQRMGDQGGEGDTLDQKPAVHARDHSVNAHKEDKSACFQARLRSMTHTPPPATDIEHYAKVPNIFAAVGRLTDLDDSDCEHETTPSPKQERSVWALEEQGISLEDLGREEFDDTNVTASDGVMVTLPSTRVNSRLLSGVESSDEVVSENMSTLGNAKLFTEQKAVDEENMCASLSTIENNNNNMKSTIEKKSTNDDTNTCSHRPPRPEVPFSKGIAASRCKQKLLQQPITGEVPGDCDDREDESDSSPPQESEKKQSEREVMAHAQVIDLPPMEDNSSPHVEDKVTINANSKDREGSRPINTIVAPERSAVILSLGSTSTNASDDRGSTDATNASREAKEEALASRNRAVVLTLDSRSRSSDESRNDGLSSPSSQKREDVDEDVIAKAHAFFSTIESIRSLGHTNVTSNCDVVGGSSSLLGEETEEALSSHNKSGTSIIKDDHTEVGSACTPTSTKTPDGSSDKKVGNEASDLSKTEKSPGWKSKRARHCGSGPPRPEVPNFKGTTAPRIKKTLLQPITGAVPEEHDDGEDASTDGPPETLQNIRSEEEARGLEQMKIEDTLSSCSTTSITSVISQYHSEEGCATSGGHNDNMAPGFREAISDEQCTSQEEGYGEDENEDETCASYNENTAESVLSEIMEPTDVMPDITKPMTLHGTGPVEEHSENEYANRTLEDCNTALKGYERGLEASARRSIGARVLTEKLFDGYCASDEDEACCECSMPLLRSEAEGSAPECVVCPVLNEKLEETVKKLKDMDPAWRQIIALEKEQSDLRKEAYEREHETHTLVEKEYATLERMASIQHEVEVAREAAHEAEIDALRRDEECCKLKSTLDRVTLFTRKVINDAQMHKKDAQHHARDRAARAETAWLGAQRGHVQVIRSTAHAEIRLKVAEKDVTRALARRDVAAENLKTMRQRLAHSKYHLDSRTMEKARAVASSIAAVNEQEKIFKERKIIGQEVEGEALAVSGAANKAKELADTRHREARDALEAVEEEVNMLEVSASEAAERRHAVTEERAMLEGRIKANEQELNRAVGQLRSITTALSRMS